MKNLPISIGLGLVLLGCGIGTQTLDKVATPDFIDKKTPVVLAAVPELNAQAAAPAPLACDVKLFIEQLPSGGASPIAEGNVGVLVVEKQSESELVNGVCIKRPDEKLELPASMLIAGADDGPRLGRFCLDDAKSYTLRGKQGETQQVNACTWNGVFHAARPFTLTLLTDPSRSLSDYVEFVRVYRNGDLMAAWNRASDRLMPYKAVIAGSGLRTGVVAASHPPHLSAMDIRVIPREDGVAHVVDTATRDDLVRFKAKLSAAGTAALDAFLPQGSDERKSLECLRDSLRADMRQIAHIVNGEVALSPSCDVLNNGARIPLDPADQSRASLSEKYADIKNQSRERLVELRAQAYDEVDALKEKILNALPAKREHVGKVLRAALSASLQGASENAKAAVETCVADLLEHKPGKACDRGLIDASPQATAAYDKVVKIATVVDADVQSLLGTVDESLALADRLAEKGRDVASSPAKQADIFKAVVESLHETAGEPFEPRRENPALLPGEQKIDMLYSDKLQFFFLAPWNGVPLRAKSAEADLSAAVVVPLLDAAGVRYQWAKSRFADLRWAVGIGYVETEVPGTDQKQTGALPNTSVGIGTFKVGLGYVTGKGLGDTPERLRVVLGADLFKLISGSNAEAF